MFFFLEIFDSETSALDLSRGYGCTANSQVTRFRQYVFSYPPDLMIKQVGIYQVYLGISSNGYSQMTHFFWNSYYRLYLRLDIFTPQKICEHLMSNSRYGGAQI